MRCMTRRRCGLVPRVRRILAAVCSGLMLAQGANGHGWWLSILGLALLFTLMRHNPLSERVLVVVVTTFVWFGVHLIWMRVLGIDAWLLLVLLCVLPWIAIALVFRSKHGWHRYLVMASGVVLIEWLHSNFPWGGFPWGNLAYSQIDGPLVGLSRWGGQSLVAAAVAIAAVAISQAIMQRSLVVPVSIVTLLLVAGVIALRPVPTSHAREIGIALVQGGTSQEGPNGQQQWKVFDQHVQQTQRLGRAVAAGREKRPDLIVWPENSTDIDPINDLQARHALIALANGLKTSFLIGGVTWLNNPYGPRNAGILWVPSLGPKYMYVKNHLVPFGEYVPLRSVLASRVGRLNQIPADFVPGRGVGKFSVAGQVIGDAICFEVAHEDYMTKLVQAGANVLMVQTNNATYLGTHQSEQQFAIARFRAIEHQRPLVMVSTTGVSGFIGESGEVVAKTQQGEATYRVVQVAGSNQTTFADEHPDWVRNASIAFFIALCFGRTLNKRRVSKKLADANG